MKRFTLLFYTFIFIFILACFSCDNKIKSNQSSILLDSTNHVLEGAPAQQINDQVNNKKETKWKTSTFDNYQQSQSFKGILFGLPLSVVKEKLNLEDLNGSYYEIKNPDYLKFDIYEFNSAEAYFTKSDKFFQVVLWTDDFYPACAMYVEIKKHLLFLFGENDQEYTYDPKDEPKKFRNITWEGKNITIQLAVDPVSRDDKENNKARLSLMIYQKDLNQLDQDERTKETGIPKI